MGGFFRLFTEYTHHRSKPASGTDVRLCTDGLYQVEDFDYDAATKTYTLKDGIPYMGDKQNVQPGNWKFKNLDGSADNKITEVGQDGDR